MNVRGKGRGKTKKAILSPKLLKSRDLQEKNQDAGLTKICPASPSDVGTAPRGGISERLALECRALARVRLESQNGQQRRWNLSLLTDEQLKTLESLVAGAEFASLTDEDELKLSAILALCSKGKKPLPSDKGDVIGPQVVTPVQVI